MWNPYKFDVGPSKSVAEAIFGPYGQLQREFISLDWDISDSKFEYEYKDFSSRIGQKQNEYIYNSHDQLQQETIYQFYDPMNGQGIPTFDFNDYNTLQTTAQMEPYNSYEAAAEKSGWILGMNLTLNSAGLSIGGKIYREQAINYKTEYEYYPFFNSTKKVRFFDDDPNIYNEIVEEYSAYNPLTNKPVLTMNNHPENPEKMLYTLSVPAYTKFDFLGGLNMYDLEYQQIRGVVLNNSVTTPLSSKISEWGLLATGEEVPPGEPTPELPVVTKSYVWRGGVNPTIYLNNATSQNWLLTNELLEINEYGLPLREIDGLGTISSVKYDKDKVTLVAVNADPNEVFYDNYQGEEATDETLLESKAGRYLIIPANGTHLVDDLPPGESFVDFIASSDTPGPIQVSIDGTIYALNLLRSWQYFKFEYNNNSSVNLVVNSDGRETKFDELRVYPQTALVSNFVYDPNTYELIAIEDANGQITNYRYDDFNQLAMITNSRDQLLKRFYYDSQNMHYTAVPEP